MVLLTGVPSKGIAFSHHPLGRIIAGQVLLGHMRRYWQTARAIVTIRSQSAVVAPAV